MSTEQASNLQDGGDTDAAATATSSSGGFAFLMKRKMAGEASTNQISITTPLEDSKQAMETFQEPKASSQATLDGTKGRISMFANRPTNPPSSMKGLTLTQESTPPTTNTSCPMPTIFGKQPKSGDDGGGDDDDDDDIAAKTGDLGDFLRDEQMTQTPAANHSSLIPSAPGVQPVPQTPVGQKKTYASLLPSVAVSPPNKESHSTKSMANETFSVSSTSLADNAVVTNENQTVVRSPTIVGTTPMPKPTNDSILVHSLAEGNKSKQDGPSPSRSKETNHQQQQNSSQVSVQHLQDYQTPRPFSDTGGVSHGTTESKSVESFDGIPIKTPFATPLAPTTLISNPRTTLDQENVAPKPSTTTTQKNLVFSSGMEDLFRQEMVTNVVTPAATTATTSRGSKVPLSTEYTGLDNTTSPSDDKNINKNIRDGVQDDPTVGDLPDWQGIQGDFAQTMQDCGDILYSLDSDMLHATELLETAHADLQGIQAKVMDQIVEMEQLEQLLDDMIESPFGCL